MLQSRYSDPGSPAEWSRTMRTVMSRYAGSAMVNSGTYRITGASSETAPRSTSVMTAAAVTTLLTEPIP